MRWAHAMKEGTIDGGHTDHSVDEPWQIDRALVPHDWYVQGSAAVFLLPKCVLLGTPPRAAHAATERLLWALHTERLWREAALHYLASPGPCVATGALLVC